MKAQETNFTSTQSLTQTTGIKLYQGVDTHTGEVYNKYKYLPGRPKQYRFDAKEGKFNINGIQKLGSSFTLQPVAWRIFEDDILQMGKKKWAELFFIDDNNCLSALLFHGFTVDNLFKLIEPLFYDDLTLADVVITATAEKKENTKISPKGVYYIAQFTYQVAEKQKVEELQSFAKDFPIYRQETLTDTAEIKVSHQFFNPLHALPEDTTEESPNRGVA
jgi:hypothetical protein